MTDNARVAADASPVDRRPCDDVDDQSCAPTRQARNRPISTTATNRARVGGEWLGPRASDAAVIVSGRVD